MRNLCRDIMVRSVLYERSEVRFSDMKSPMSDIKISDRRSVRHIPMPEHRRGGSATHNSDPLQYEEDRYETVEVEIENRGWSRAALWLAVGLCVALLVFVFSWSFTGATIIVTPKSADIVLNHKFEASKTGGGLTTTFETLTQSKIGESVIPALAQKRVSQKASGAIVAYNNYSEATQRLIRNTRFESPQGLIYRIDSSIVVPGRKKEDGRYIPGSVEALVFADSPGEKYNSQPTDFTVPGFKSDPARYAAFYARSKTPITGGFEGMQKIPTETDEKTARESVRQAIIGELIDVARQSIPADFVFFNDAYKVATEQLPNEERGAGNVAVKEKITLTAFFIPRADISKEIAKKVLSDSGEKDIFIPSLKTLSFKLAADSQSEKKLSFTLTGNAKIVYSFNNANLSEALRGKHRNEVAAVLSSFPTIEKVEVKLHPFWSRSFPDTAEKLKIEIVPLESS